MEKRLNPLNEEEGKRMSKDMVVTPYEVKGKIDYDRLIAEFGISPIDKKLQKRLDKYLKNNHFIRRGIFFAHRDLEFILDQYEKGNKFYLYTGRGPSDQIHIGHLVSYMFTKQLQDAFKAKLLFQMTDDEKFLFKPNLSIEETNRLAYDNALDIIACGFDPNRTEIFSDIDYAKTLYRQSLRVAKHLTFSSVKAMFGFEHSTNVGSIFFTSMQSVPAFLESARQNKNIPCLIVHGVDQDTHFRATRDVLPKLGYYKPASIQCKFTPGLGKGGKMSSSEPETAIFTTDNPKQIEKKIMSSFTGGKETVEEQKKFGGNPDICPIYQYFYLLFEEDDRKLLEDHYKKCKEGKILCGEHKKQLVPRVQKFISEHQKRREEARKTVDKFMVKD